MSGLGNIRIILVEPSHPGNIGAVARAMKTMCLERLYLIKPKYFPHAEATARASGADDILAKAILCASLSQAVKGCSLVFATSARKRSLRWPQLTPRECAHQAILEVQRGEVGVVFGREQSGLSNVELDICHAMVSIPCNPRYSSLNLAAALQIVCYELLLAREDPRAKAAIDDVPIKDDIPAEIEQVEQYYEHLERTLITLGFLNPHHPKHLMRRLRRLFNRSRLSWKEIKILRGILTSVEKRMLRQGPF